MNFPDLKQLDTNHNKFKSFTFRINYMYNNVIYVIRSLSERIDKK